MKAVTVIIFSYSSGRLLRHRIKIIPLVYLSFLLGSFLSVVSLPPSFLFSVLFLVLFRVLLNPVDIYY